MRDPEASLADIVHYAQRALRYVEGLELGHFLDDEGVQDQVIRCLSVIGEAARRTPDEVRHRYPAVPWIEMTGMRNRLAHEYDGIDMELVWRTVVRDLPAVLDALGAQKGPDP